ncbi:MAG TPA: DoxX family protein [Labilithrix sp.]|nr:DoxX family protein [Labilithrix sp.]
MTARVSNGSALTSLETFSARGLLARLSATTADIAPLAARVALGAVIFPHGAQKVLGWFGGYGFAGTMGFMTGQLGIPAVFAALAIAAEFFGAIGLVVGAFSRVAAFGIAVTMAVAALMVHTKAGFFMNWTGTQAGEGFEYHLLAIGLAVVVMLKGSGAYSLDRLIGRRLAQ